MNMPRITLVYGILMVVIGVTGYFITGSKTSLIPSGLGVLVFIAGVFAAREILRKHMMHLAVLVSLIAVYAGGKRLWIQFQQFSVDGHFKNPAAFISISIMVAVSLAFTALCIRSFVVARLIKK